jgi:transcriptional repressor NrdR
MEVLKGLDPVAFIRFASVYENFNEVKDFAAVLKSLERP